ncbi:MAG TPA: hypothetical protein VKB35_20265 [Ktedonobacteraceae bacterium]|nr:hypothetical protein [Ktedonobacteraceae bacterium]
MRWSLSPRPLPSPPCSNPCARIQHFIDRRFYRRKYDAAKIIAAFSTTLRAETDLDRLCEQLLAVVEQTMQPTHVSLWIRQPPQRKPEPDLAEDADLK